jgi:hypothetical protein
VKRLMQIGRIAFNADTTDPYFFDEPLCKYSDPEAWFDENHESSHRKLAIEICGTCKHEVECAAYAIVNPDIVGIWGATTTSERKQIRKKLNINENNYDNIIDDDFLPDSQ